MRLWMRRNGLNPQGSFFLHPRTAGTSGRMWIGRSSKIARTAEVGARLKSPVWFRLGRLREWVSLCCGELGHHNSSNVCLLFRAAF